MNKKTRIGIIGLGALGKRHLESVLELKISLQVLVFDWKSLQIDIADRRVRVVPDINLVLRNTDLVIVSTVSLGRAEILLHLYISGYSVIMMLEKVLFNSLSAYFEAYPAEFANRVYVNHPRRYFPIWRLVRKVTRHNKIRRIEVSGGDWGLLCNYSHFVELVCWLTGDYKEIKNIFTDLRFTESKRDGFIEAYGVIEFIKDGIKCVLRSDECQQPLTTSVHLTDQDIIVDEQGGSVKFYSAGKVKELNRPTFLRFQSNLTGKYIKQALSNFYVDLPLLGESILCHRSIFGSIVREYRHATNSDFDEINIT